jgi:molecular chaperone GrpE
MNKKEKEIDDIDEPGDGKLPVNDKRRFNDQGERIADDPMGVEPATSPAELALESALKTETERRQAAESKLVGVQAKFEEAKANLEKETTEMRARLMKTLEDRGKQAQFNFLTTLLPVLDNLNLAVAASETDPSIEHLRNGVVGTVRSFERALIDVGVEPIVSIGASFDPELHEAVDMAPADAENDGRVLAEYARGYRFGDKLLRPARVQVGKAMADSAGE